MKNKLNEIKAAFDKLLSDDNDLETMERAAKLLAAKFLSQVEKNLIDSNLTKKELAREINIPAKKLKQFFKGDKIIDLKTLAKIEKALEIKFEIGIEEEKTSMTEQNIFPLEVFPKKLQPMIKYLSGNQCIEPSFIGTTILAVMSMAMGSGQKVRMGTYIENMNLNTCLVGSTASGKSILNNFLFQRLKEIASHPRHNQIDGNYLIEEYATWIDINRNNDIINSIFGNPYIRENYNVWGATKPSLLGCLVKEDTPRYNILFATESLESIIHSYYQTKIKGRKKWEKLIDDTYMNFPYYDEFFKISSEGLMVFEEWRKETKKWADNGVNASDQSTRMSIYSSMKQYCVRFAGILHAMDVAGIEERVLLISPETVERAVKLCNYYTQTSYSIHQKTI